MSGRTHVRPTHRVRRGPVECHELLVLEDHVGQVNAERELEQAEAEPDRAVLATERHEPREVEDLSVLAQLRFARDRVDVVRAVDEEAAVATRAGVFQQALLKSARGV